MRELIENSQQAERAVLVCVDCGDYDPESSLDELEELTKTAGAEVYDAGHGAWHLPFRRCFF